MIATRTEPVLSETQQALLEAAGEVFAEQGYRAATVREICQRAGANIAAVNYHFGDKEGLYAAVLKYAHRCMYQQFPVNLGAPPDASPIDRLRAYVHAFLLRMFHEGRPSWFGRLMAREMIDPTAALADLVEQEIRPQADQLARIVADILHLDPEDDVVRLCGFSVVSQCLFHHHCQPVITLLSPAQKYGADEIAELADHITRFSMAALKEFGRRNAVGRPRRK